MEDHEIIARLFQREEAGLTDLQEQYGRLCRDIAARVLPDPRDVEECVSDSYLRVWNAIPPQRPRSLRAFLARTVRNLALDRYAYNTAAQRSSALTTAFEELEAVLTDQGAVPEQAVEAGELRAFLNGFLQGLSQMNRVCFVRRYWYGESVGEIAQAFHISESQVKSALFRTRNQLRSAMRKDHIGL